MTLLVVYVLVALIFSFLYSIAEAVLLSVGPAYVSVLEKAGRPAGVLLRELKEDVGKPLAAILTLNTIAHTVGAAGAGAQAAVVFGSAWVGLASAVLTLLILVLSEIIPNTLGARHWRRLAPATAWGLQWLVRLMWPFVRLSDWITRWLGGGEPPLAVSRRELAALAEIGGRQGQLRQDEARIVRNLLRLRETRVESAMTPRTVVFSLPEGTTVAGWFDAHADSGFSRIPIYSGEPEQVTGFVMRTDLLLARAQDRGDEPLATFRRELEALPESLPLVRAFRQLVQARAHIMLVVDEYGGMEGILTLEDVLETMLGLEIVDEADAAVDMQAVARELWRRRARHRGLDDETSSERGAP